MKFTRPIVDDISNTITKTNIPQFSEWTAAGMNTPLPLEVADMKVSCGGSYPVFSWKSLKEVNTSRFVVETSADGRSWDVAGTLAAAGNSASVLSYRMELKGNLNAMKLVRLTVQDLDGTKRTFRAFAVSCTGLQNGRSVQIVPNPNDGLFAVQVEGGSSDELLDIRVINSLGQEVAGQLSNPARAAVKIDIRELPKGIYRVQIRGEESREEVSTFNVLVK